MEPIDPIGINSLGHIAPIGPVEAIGPIGVNCTYRAIGPMEQNGPIGINSLVHIAPNGLVESIGPIGINSTSGANWAMKPCNWPKWHQFIGTYRTNWARGTN